MTFTLTKLFIFFLHRGLIIYNLENQPKEYKRVDPPLKYQHRCISIFRDKKNPPQPTGMNNDFVTMIVFWSCIESIFLGFALGSIEGRVAIQYANAQNPKDNFTFKCHRSNGTTNGFQDIYAVNDIAFHPVHGTLATVGSDGRFSFWDKDARTKLKTSEAMEQPITCCAFNSNGQVCYQTEVKRLRFNWYKNFTKTNLRYRFSRMLWATTGQEAMNTMIHARRIIFTCDNVLKISSQGKNENSFSQSSIFMVNEMKVIK